MNDHVAKPIDKESAWCCLLGHLGRSGAGARRQRQRTRANWSRRGAISPGVFGGSLELIVRVLRRFVPDMQDLFAQLERQLGEGDVQGSAATLHTIKGSASTAGASARRASWTAPRRLLRGMENPRRHPRAPCAMPACSACRRCSATCRRSRRAEPWRGGQSRQDSGGPGLACIRCGL